MENVRGLKPSISALIASPFRSALTPDGVFVCHEHMDDETVSTSAYLNEFYFPMGERWLAGAVAYDDADYEVSLAFNRSRGQAPFGPEERRLIASMLPHVRRAASLASASQTMLRY